jgi:saccharopine dehydrogenase-like NADP-dependent oxidoreductase
MNRQKELQRLCVADRHIAQAERAVSEQILNIEKLRRDGHDTGAAEKTLETFRKTLQVMNEHRCSIVETLKQIDSGLI